MLNVRRFDDPTAFIARAGSFLMRSEAENALMLGICGPRRSRRRVFDDSCYLATVENGEHVVACALRTPPYKALISRAERDALEHLVDDLAFVYETLPTVAGPEPDIALFAPLWSARTGARARFGMRHRLFETRRVVPPPRPPGIFRVAENSDLSTVGRWAAAFFEEARLDDPSSPLDVALERIREGSIVVWADPHPVSMAGWAGRTERTVRVNFVYTPPEYRRRGYASACVAALTQQLLEEGLAFCTLYTNLANPTSNKIYQAIGYRPVCDMTDVHFTAG